MSIHFDKIFILGDFFESSSGRPAFDAQLTSGMEEARSKFMLPANFLASHENRIFSQNFLARKKRQSSVADAIKMLESRSGLFPLALTNVNSPISVPRRKITRSQVSYRISD
jgi:hypothetical protein